MGGGVGEAEVPVSPVRMCVMLPLHRVDWGSLWDTRVVAGSSSLPLPQPGLYRPCPGRSHGLYAVSLNSLWSCLFIPLLHAVELKCRWMRRDWFLPGLLVTPVALGR